MSRNEWARGTIVLPSAEYAKFRQAIQDAAQRELEQRFESTQKFWKSLTAKERGDWEEYKRVLYRSGTDVDSLLFGGWPRPDKPRRVLKSDIEWPTNRTVVYRRSNLSITFNREKREVVYDVDCNNHAVEHARESALGKAFFSALSKVRWAYGTGGVILGNDEYNEESGQDYEGGGGSYVVAAYGYAGADIAPTHVQEFLNSRGHWVHVETRVGRSGITGKVVAGPDPRSRVYPARRMW